MLVPDHLTTREEEVHRHPGWLVSTILVTPAISTVFSSASPTLVWESISFMQSQTMSVCKYKETMYVCKYKQTLSLQLLPQPMLSSEHPSPHTA